MSYQKQNTYQNKTARNKLNAQATTQDTNVYLLLPILFVIAVLPLITKIRQYKTPLTEFPWFSGGDTYIDFFLYYKSMIFTGIFIIMVIIILLKASFDRKSLQFSPIFVPLCVYAFMAFLSSVLSKYRSYSFSGIYEQFESIFVILGYCLLVYYVYTFVKSERDVRYVINALLICALILGALGLGQLLGHNYFYSKIGWNLISNNAYREYMKEFTLTFGEEIVFLTLYNPNYTGVYAALVTPILFMSAAFAKRIWVKSIYLLACAGLIVCLIGSGSTAGFVSVIIAFLLSLVMLWRFIIKYFYISLPVAIIAVAALLLFNYQNNDYISRQIGKITDIKKTEKALTDIQTNDNELVIIYNGNKLRTQFYQDESDYCFFQFLDENENIVNSSFDALNSPVTIMDERFPEFVFTPAINHDILGFYVQIDGHEWFFTNQIEDKTYYYGNIYGKYDKIITAPSAVFTGYESFATDRGYIWSRTIPLLKKYPIIGSGADTFSIAFPQQDYVNSYNFGFENQFLTKPHSLYLQIGVQSGVLALLAFLLFYVMYFVSSLKLYIRGRFTSYYSQVGVAILVGTVGYMISIITNDSCITVAPVFWALIGVGITVNSKVKQELNKA